MLNFYDYDIHHFWVRKKRLRNVLSFVSFVKETATRYLEFQNIEFVVCRAWVIERFKNHENSV